MSYERFSSLGTYKKANLYISKQKTYPTSSHTSLTFCKLTLFLLYPRAQFFVLNIFTRVTWYIMNTKNSPSPLSAFSPTPEAYQELLTSLEQTRKQLDLTQQQLQSTRQQLHKAQSEVFISGDSLKSILKSMPFAMHIWSQNHTMIDASIKAAELFGFSSVQELMDNFYKTLPEFQPNGEYSKILCHKYLDEALTHEAIRKNWLHIDIEGKEVPCEITFIANTWNNERVVYVFLRDLRERNAILTKLEESHEYSKIMLDASPVGAMIWDHTGTPVGCNTAMCKAFGLRNHDEFMQNLAQLYPPYQPDGSPSLQKMQEQLQKAFTEGHAEGPWMGTSIDGKEVPTAVTAVRTRHNGQDMVVVFYKDLREVEESIRKAQAAEKRTEAILNGVPMGINILTPEAKIIDANEEALHISRFYNKEKFLADVMQSFPPTQANGQSTDLFIQDKFMQTAQNGKSRFELLAIDANQELYSMDTTLVRAHIEKEDLYIAYCMDLRETHKMLSEIQDAQKAAEQSAQAKSDFLANMSHEIRTPMNGILGLLRILSGTKLNTMQQSYLEKALFSTHELLRIINDILDFSKIEAGKLELENTSFTIHEICSELESLFGHTIQEKGLTHALNEGQHSTLRVLGDPLRLKQVLLNLINNAIKFTEKGQVSLDITSEITNDTSIKYQFAIKDTGIGLSQEQVQNLFSAFTQADTSVTRKYGGTGLGLVISKRIVHMLQGEIWVESTPGKGSTFFFTATFPLTDQKAAPLCAPLNDTQDYQAQGEHILLVEDNQINQIIAEELLQSMGYTVDIANNGQEALNFITQKPYDAILMDIQMPIMDGLTATKTLRQNPQYAQLPIIAMSAHAMAGDREKSLKHGMNEHITKPIVPEILFSTLRRWLSQKGNS